MKVHRFYLAAITVMMVALFCSAAWLQAADKPIVLKSLIQSPPKAKYSKSFDAYLDDVEKATNGRIKFERYYSSALAKAPEILDAVGGGIADIAVFVATYAPGKIPLATVGYLPGLYDHVWVSAKAYLELYDTIPEMNEEMTKNNVKFVAPWGTGPYYVFSKKEIRTLEDLKGQKLAATGQIGILMKSLGAVPVGLPITESYTALDRGTIDGVCYGPSAAAAYSVHEVAKYLFKIRTGGGVGPIILNLDKWKKMPADLQKIMLDVGKEHPKNIEQVYQIEGDQASLAKMLKAGLIVIEPSADMKAKVREIINTQVLKKWAGDMEAKGLPGNKMLTTYQSLLEKYEPLCPFK